jgi:hypothetical protein
MAALPPLVETQGYPRRLDHEHQRQHIQRFYRNLSAKAPAFQAGEEALCLW